MKKKLLAAMLGLALFVGAGTIVWAEDISEAAGIEDENHVDPLTVSDEGYVIRGDGYYSVNAWCKNGEDDIFGRIYYPEDFDETEKYTAVVLVHGMTLNCDFWHKIYAPELAKAGYICYAFDERSGTEYGRGSFSTPLEDGVSDVEDTASDASAALDFVESLDYVDQDSIYLFGNSKGSMASQVLASRRNDEIAGVVALYGGLAGASKEMVPDIETVKANPYHNGEVLVIWGTKDTGYNLESTLESMSWYEESSVVLISDAAHGFGNQNNRPANICIEAVIDYLDRTKNGIVEEGKKTSRATDEDLTASEEGYTYEGDGYSFTVQYASKEDVEIFGRMYYPADFEENHQYPVIVTMHASNGNADSWDKAIVPRIAQEGYLVYAIDARSGQKGGRGSYSTPLEGTEDGEATVENFADDIEIALDYVKTLSYVDPEAIYVMGGSKGGVATQVAAARRSDEIAGMIIQNGAIEEPNSQMVADFASLKANPYRDGEVLFVQGVDDESCLISTAETNMNWYEHYTLVAMSGTGHGFGYQNDRSTEVLVDSIREFMYRTTNHIGEE